ncbi:hypothetical protein [Helicobacter bilis]|uniref:hypothetical protein n=1 Tax=Helicobacter bilis TaxID=37372 RepID=UPI00248DEBD7|nr:hypothetical protein [Helicobacter bilis]
MTTNLLKQAQDKANTANLNAQNSQNKQTQQNIGNAISMGNNVLSMQTNQNTLSYANNTNTTPTQAKTFNEEIALSSDRDFKPQSEIP